MEYYTQEAIEKANKIDPKKKKIKQIMKKIIVFIITFLIVYIVIMPTPLFDLAVVSIRWGRPMIYKEHIQMGAIWDLRKRTHTAFTAYPLFGDPEEDEFCIERDNRLIVFPWDIEDGYFYVYKRDDIEAEATRIAHEAGFEDVKVYLSETTSPKGLWKNASIDDIKNSRNVNLRIVIFSKYIDTMTDEEIIEKFENMQSEYSEWNADVELLKMTFFYNDSDFESTTREKRQNGRCICLTSRDGKKAFFYKD